MNWKKQLTILFLLAYTFVSGGTIMYSHFCKNNYCQAQPLSAIKHSCEKKEFSKSCHGDSSHNHSQDKEENNCCDEQAQFKTVDQVSVKVEKFLPLVYLATFHIYQFFSEQKINIPISFADVPILQSDHLYRLYERYLC